MTKNSPLDEQQVDSLLQQFFQVEMSPQLNVPPSQWSQIRHRQIEQAERGVPQLQLVSKDHPRQSGQTRSIARTISVVASLAACLFVGIMISQSQSNTIDTQNTIEVSSGHAPAAATVDSEGTTLQEVDQIDLNP